MHIHKLVKLNDYIDVYIIGYPAKGESILIDFSGKFCGVIDCYRTSFNKTKDLIESLGYKHLDFIYWNHSDDDHTLGLSELIEHFSDYDNSLTLYTTT